MCFSDLVSTNRQPMARFISQVDTAEGAERVGRLGGGFISPSAHVGNWELAGRLLAGRTARTTHVVVAEEEARELEQWVRRDGGGVRFVTRSRPPVSPELVAEPFSIPRGGGAEAARAWVAMLEDVVREHPTQWFNFFDIWNPVLA